MNEKRFTTIGVNDYPGFEVKISCARDVTTFEEECIPDRFRMVLIKQGYATLQNGENCQALTAPTVLCINHTDHVKLLKAQHLVMDVMVFDPACFEQYIPYDSIEAWRQTLGVDAHFFRAFFERSDFYIGACATTPFMGCRITQLISRTEQELVNQSGDWPCKSRSFFIELLLLVNTIYDEDEVNDRIYAEKMTDDVRHIINWLNTHFVEKIVLEDITKQFGTNKTTLNQKFKDVMGVTVTEYVINLRMQVACSCLRKTMIPVKEIVQRTGYKDDTHFLRAFKKYAGCTPTEYRNKYAVGE